MPLEIARQRKDVGNDRLHLKGWQPLAQTGLDDAFLLEYQPPIPDWPGGAGARELEIAMLFRTVRCG